MIQAALHEAGVVHLPVVLLQPYIDSGRLVEVLGDFGRDDLWLVAASLRHRHRHRTAAQRAFLQFLDKKVAWDR